MSAADQKQFLDAVSRAKAGGHISFVGDPYSTGDEWVAAVQACNRLAMFDMLPAVQAIEDQRDDLEFLTAVNANKSVIGEASAQRIRFAFNVITDREIEDVGLPDDQVNDEREFLGCTRLDDDGVQQIINDALHRAGAVHPDTACCEAIGKAWSPILVDQRRVPGGSLKANLAAAAHYMLARYHVCAALTYPWQMKKVIDAYDEEKRFLIASGDRELRKIALTGNRPFPPDFAIRKWAYKGADTGDADRMRCNSKASRPLLFPNVNGKEWGIIPDLSKKLGEG
jgi:hypothetical protein